jgi:hypothetical protein
MAAVYTENHKRPGLYSVRVGGFNISKVNNLMPFTRAEAMAMKAAPVPEGGQTTEIWHDTRDAGDPLIDLNHLKARVLPYNHPDSLGDYVVLEAFRKGDDTTIKAALYNRRSDTFWFVTGTNVKPTEKHSKAVEHGWYVFRTYLIAPPAFWRKVRERI